MKRIFLAFTCIFLTSFCYSQLQSYNFNAYSINNGLSSNWITCILKDSQGYLWIGSRYGLNRFDGHTFKQYYNVQGDSQSLSGNRITKLFEDRKGNVWIGTWQSGLSLYDRESDKFRTFPSENDEYQSLKNGYIRDINQDSNGNLWVGTGEEGLMIFNFEKNDIKYLRKLPESKNSLSSNKVTSVVRDAGNNFWIASREGTIDVVNSTTYLISSVRIDPKVSNAIKNTDVILYFDSDSLLWIGSAGGGVFAYDKKLEKSFAFPQVSNKSILDFIQKGNEILIATDNGGINIYNKERKEFQYLISNPFDPRSLKSNGIYDLYFDNQGLLWVATFDAGLNFSRSKITPFKHFYSIPNLEGTISHNNVSAICETDDGRIFVATDGGGLNEFFPAKESFIRIHADPKAIAFNDNNITCLYYSNNKLYVAAYEKGLNIYNLNTGKIEILDRNFLGYKPDYENIEPIINVWCVLKDSKNNLWIGTINNGLYCFNPQTGRVENFQHQSSDPKSISHNSIITLLEDRDHNLWIGTEGGGLNQFNYSDKSFNSYLVSEHNKNSISNNSINSIFEDDKGNIWIGTSGGGLNKFNKQTGDFKAFCIEDGLPINIVLDILEDDSKNLWISTTMGLCRFNEKRRDYLIFKPSEGLQSVQFSQTACLKSKAGVMYFGGVEGLNIFRPEIIKINEEQQNLVFTDFKILNKSVRAGTKELSKFRGTLSSKTPSVILTYKDYVFSIEFASLDYTSPEKIKYKYYMEGFDHSWNETDFEHRLITYTNLPGGNYIFYVKAAKNSENWGEPITMQIKVVPPFWKTIWFVIGLGVLIASLIIVYIKGRTRFLNRQKLQLEIEVNDRILEIRQQNEYIKEQNEELEKHRTRLEELIEIRTKDLLDAKKRAEKADLLKTSFLANMSHEIRTPMNAILGFVNLLLENEGDIELENRKKYLTIINNNGYSLLKLINDIIDIAKIESDQLEIIKTNFNLIDLLMSLYLEYSESVKYFRKNNNTIELHTSGLNEVNVLSDEGRLRSILVNFLENAVKFTDNGIIKIGIRESDENISVYVNDNGIGIAPENHHFIFERFTKLEESQQRLFRGTGIGLYISKRIIEMLGYKLNLISELGQGAEFIIEIPRKNLISINRKTQIKEQNKIKLNGENKTILIVEDEIDNYAYINTVLEKANFKTLWAANGLVAVKLCREYKDLDIVLMDIKMPVMNGIDATKEIRKFNQDIPIIAQTAYAMSFDKTSIMESGCNDYISKPIDKQKLFIILNKFL